MKQPSSLPTGSPAAAKADWLRTAARIALWDLGWIDEGRKGLELAHAIHHEPLETNLNELASLDETLRVRRYRELTWVWSAPDDVPLLNHWFDWALLTEHETLPEIVELCRATDMLTDARWLGLLSSETVFTKPNAGRRSKTLCMKDLSHTEI